MAKIISRRGRRNAVHQPCFLERRKVNQTELVGEHSSVFSLHPVQKKREHILIGAHGAFGKFVPLGFAAATFQVILYQFREGGGRFRGESLIQLLFLFLRFRLVPCPKRLLETVPVLVLALVVEDASFLVE